MHRLHRRVVRVLGRRVVLVVGLLCLLLGSVGALVIGSDDTIGVGDTQVSGVATGLPVVTYPVFTTLGGAEMAVTARAAGGVYVGSAHRVDITDLVNGVRHYEIAPLSGDNDGKLVEGRATRLQPDKILGWRESSSGEGEQRVIVPLDQEPVGVVAVALNPQDRVSVSFGVHVGGLFLKTVVIAGAGLLLILAWGLGRWRRRAMEAGGPQTTGDTGGAEAEPEPVPVDSNTPAQYAAEPVAVITAVPERPPNQPTPIEPTPTPPIATVLPATALVSLRPPAPPRPTPGRMGVTAVAVMALAWSAGRARKRFLGLFLALFLLSGCGNLTGTTEQPRQTKVAVEGSSDAEALVADYLTRRTRAAKRAAAPRYDGSRWSLSETGPLLSIAQYQAIVDNIARPKGKPRRPKLTGGAVYSPTFKSYPMWAAMVLEGESHSDLVVFTRAGFAEPWLASTSARLRTEDLPAPIDVARTPSSRAITVAALAASQLQQFWATGAPGDLMVGKPTREARESWLRSAPAGSIPAVTEWPEPLERVRMVQTAKGHLVVTLHDVRIGGLHSVLTTALFVPPNGAPRVLGSTLARILN